MNKDRSPNVYIITTEWPCIQYPNSVPFLVEQVKLLTSQGICIKVFHFEGRRNIFHYLKAWYKIRKTAFWQEADILHAHWGQSAFLALFSNKKLVITFHGSDLQGIVDFKGNQTVQGMILTAFSRWIAKKADYCIVVSSRLISKLPKRCKKIIAIPIGVNLRQFYPMDKIKCRKQLKIDLEPKIVLFMSDPNRAEKRFSLAEEAVDNYQKLHPELEIQLLVVSGIDHNDVPIYVNSGDVLILTSTHEGGPTVVKEALACKVPIVSFDVGDVAERISGVDGCYLCDEESVECLVKGLEITLNHGPLQDLPDSALKQLDERKNVLEVIEIYETLLHHTV